MLQHPHIHTMKEKDGKIIQRSLHYNIKTNKIIILRELCLRREKNIYILKANETILLDTVIVFVSIIGYCRNCQKCITKIAVVNYCCCC